MFSSFQIFYVLFILNRIISILCDCGFPALPVHMKVKPFTNVYFEDDVIEYYCEYEDMHLIGSDKRQCSQSKWMGDIPHCVREIPRHSLERIEIVNIKNQSISKKYDSQQLYYNPNLMDENKKYQAMTYFGNHDKNPNECIHTKISSNVSSLEWIVVFKNAISQVYSVEIVVYNQNFGDKLDLRKTDSVIKGVFVSDYRNCEPQKVQNVDIGNKLFKYSFHCQIKDLGITQNYDELNNLRFESLKNITIYFATNELIVCELHISETIPFRSFTSGSCGSPDVPLFSNYTPVFDQISHSPIPIGYSFTCDEGFHLKGNQAVMCGVNNKWMDVFPTCIPNESCHLMNKSRLNELNLSVNYRNLYSFDGNISAINGTHAIYSCLKEDKSHKNSFNKTLIGDSIRFCQINGNWSGEEPVCLDENDFTLYLAELNEDILKTESKLPKFAQHMHRIDECGFPAIPKFAKIYSYDSQLLNIYMASIQERIDLMPKYPNGSVITYHCESKFTYMASDFDARTCINGSWVGPIGQCFNPVGGTEISKAVSIEVQYATTGSDFPLQTYHPIHSETEDLFWNYLERDLSKCVALEMKKGTKVSTTIYLSMPVRASYFAIRLGAKNIFHELEENMFLVKRVSQLNSFPISAEIVRYYYGVKSPCQITKVIETGDYDDFGGITLVSFKCDENDLDNNNNNNNKMMVVNQFDNTKTNAITFHFNPDEFHENFNATNITFSGLMVFESSDDCGVPENVPNSVIISAHNSGYVRYKCKNGYKLIGNEYVRCSKYGTWKDAFPRCELYKLCDMNNKNNSSGFLQTKYYNTLLQDNEEVAVLGTIAEFKCSVENLIKGFHIMIGPRTAVCTESGQWSVEEPICADDKYFIRESNEWNGGKQNVVIPWIIVIVILICIIVIALFFVYRYYGCSNPIISIVSRRKHTRSSSTFISYGQSNLRDSVLSFNDGLSSLNSHSTA